MKLVCNIGLNTLYQVGARILTAIIGLLATRLITGSVGVEGYGDYQTVITFVTLFWIVTDFGLNAIAVRDMAANQEKEEAVFASLLTLRTSLGGILMVIAWCIVYILPYSTYLRLLIGFGATSIVFQAIMGSVNGLFQVRLRYDRQLISNAAGSLVSLGMVVLAVESDWGVPGFIAAFVATSLTMALVNVQLAKRWVRFHFSRDMQALRSLFSKTLPFGTALLLSLATFKIDMILLSTLQLGSLSNASAVGIYGLGYRVFELVLIVPVFFMNPVYPVLVRKLNESFDAFKQSVMYAGIALIAASLVIGGGVYAFAPMLIDVIADSDGFGDSVSLLRILVLWSPLFFLSALLMWNLVTLQKQTWLILIYAAGLVCNVVLNMLYIPKHTYWAAAYTTGVTEGLLVVLLSIAVFAAWKEQRG